MGPACCSSQILSASDRLFSINSGDTSRDELKELCGTVAPHKASVPTAEMIFVDRFVAIDHDEKRAWIITLNEADDNAEGQRWVEWVAEAVARPFCSETVADAVTPGVPPSFTLRHDRRQYARLIEKCLDKIRDGESYEICLTNMITSKTRLDPLTLYSNLRSLNPAPYSAYLKFGDVTVLSASPERFLRIDRSGAMEAKPIKGTAPRGKTRSQDLVLKERLQSSEKDRAENLMIVDLLRNDLGAMSEIGSVHVPKLMTIESYATVHQMVSTVRSQLRSDVHPVEAVRTAFPGGSMTGAPKVRTMSIIDELEAGPRGIYSGAIGYFSLSGAVDLSIVIRTIVMEGDSLSIGCGGAIVAMSNPDDEFQESMLKALASVQAVALTVTGDVNEYRIVGFD